MIEGRTSKRKRVILVSLWANFQLSIIVVTSRREFREPGLWVAVSPVAQNIIIIDLLSYCMPHQANFKDYRAFSSWNAHLKLSDIPSNTIPRLSSRVQNVLGSVWTRVRQSTEVSLHTLIASRSCFQSQSMGTRTRLLLRPHLVYCFVFLSELHVNEQRRIQSLLRGFITLSYNLASQAQEAKHPESLH